LDVAPKEYHRLITEWFKKVITYDLKVETASFQKLKNGRYEITIDILARRFETLKNGEIAEIPFNEPIEIGVFAKHPRQMDSDGDILYLKQNKVGKEHQLLKIIVGTKPRYIAVDPFGTRLDENRVDNITEL